MEKNFIDEFIPSKDTRAYLHSIHHEFTDLEKATIVANHIMISYEKKVKWLNSFKEKISDDTLKDRISKALVQIKKDKKYYRKCNTALGALPYNESLFDFVFIPHDFRHGDIVRSLYGGWNTTEFCEKVGIILSYLDKDYEFYKNLRGDYSDVQVCVDIKFDGVAYQGEFEHEHINPIYIERMTLNEKDERMAYLNYLTNLYRKKNIRMDAENKPEYAGGSDDLLEQKYLGKYVPVQDDTSGIWCVQTGHGFESGDINYIASEFSGTGLIYHFMHNGEMDHVHGFESVLVEILKDPKHVDIVTDYGEYSDQEIQMVKGIKRVAAFVQAYDQCRIVMSRSYKHTPVYKSTKAGNKGKKYANRSIRRKAKISPDDIQVGKSNYYRKLNQSWDICDYRFWGEPIWREESRLNLKDNPELWKKCYRRK